jgi:hypothetical protein
MVVLSSISGKFGTPGGSSYSASKFALVCLFICSIFLNCVTYGIELCVVFICSTDTSTH